MERLGQMLARTLLKCVRAHANPAQTVAWLSRVACAVPEPLSTIPPIYAGKIKFRFLSYLPVGSGFLYIGFFGFLPAKNILVFITTFPLNSAH